MLSVIPTRGRPDNLARLAEAWGTSPAWVRLDSDDGMLGGYLGRAWPEAWTVEIGPREPLSAIYNEAFRRWPDAAHFGFVADDVVPETPGWDRRLAEIAGDDGMAVPSGGHDPDGAPHFVLAGALAREQGWLCLPGLSRLYIDTVWAEIASAKGVLRRAPDVILRHRHFSNGLALMDATYRKPSAKADRAIYEQWRRTR